MGTSVQDHRDRHRVEVHVDGTLAGFAAYRLSADTITFTHTEVDDAYEGQGLGSQLASTALDAARADGLSVIPLCQFIAGYIKDHPEYVDLVPQERRARHGL